MDNTTNNSKKDKINVTSEGRMSYKTSEFFDMKDVRQTLNKLEKLGKNLKLKNA